MELNIHLKKLIFLLLVIKPMQCVFGHFVHYHRGARELVDPSSMPYIVLVGPNNCTGTVISTTHVLTATKCTEGATGWTVTTSSGDIAVDSEFTSPSEGGNSTLSILKLKTPVSGITPLSLIQGDTEGFGDVKAVYDKECMKVMYNPPEKVYTIALPTKYESEFCSCQPADSVCLPEVEDKQICNDGIGAMLVCADKGVAVATMKVTKTACPAGGEGPPTEAPPARDEPAAEGGEADPGKCENTAGKLQIYAFLTNYSSWINDMTMSAADVADKDDKSKGTRIASGPAYLLISICLLSLIFQNNNNNNNM